MNPMIFPIVMIVVICVGICIAGHYIRRCHEELLQSLVHTPASLVPTTPEQILGQMSIDPAENFSHGSTTLAGSGSTDDDHPECMICISEFLEGDVIKVLSRCKHGFHTKCIERWLLMDQSSCPTCRTSCKKNTPTESSQQQQQLNHVVDDIEAAIPSETEMASTSAATK